MQVLTDHELSVIFDYLTQHNQVSGIQVIFCRHLQGGEEGGGPQGRCSRAGEERRPEQRKARRCQRPPRARALSSAPQKQPVVQQPVSRVPQKKIVDTRKGGDVNLAKYDQRLEDLGGERAARMERKSSSGKEKIRSTNQRRGGMTFSNKRRQDEAEKMRRLQLEIAKKAPVKVMIPDEISVGELASRMKKTGAEVVKRLMKNGIMASLPQIIDLRHRCHHRRGNGLQGGA